MKVEILYSKFEDYPRIVAIQPEGWSWGIGELDSSIFGILKTEITEQQKIEWENENKWKVNDKDNPTGIVENT